MATLSIPTCALLCLAWSAATLALAQTPTQAPSPAAKTAQEQAIVPEVERRDIQRPRFPSNDFTLTLFAGSYTTQNFGSHAASGLRLGYQITEDFFVEGTLGRSKISDEAFRQILPGGIFPSPDQKLSYYNVAVGYNLLNGESFFGSKIAKLTQSYILAGTGSTKLAEQKKQTLVLGFGLRLIVNDWLAVQADLREHIFSLDLLGKRQTTRNPEPSLGLTLTF
jgi:outer membrane beta-barrel protein